MQQLRAVNLNDLVFIDTETARIENELVKGTPTYEAWEYFASRKVADEGITLEEDYKERAGLYAEFSRLVCITVGRVKDGKLVLITYKDEDEKVLLERFMGDLNTVTKRRPDTKLVGHSLKGFDIPFIFRRALVQSVIPNNLIDVGGKKPWEVTSLDTKELWKGTGYYPSSLVAICLALGIPSPKSDISGKDVGNVYHNEGEEGLARICLYCERDVMALVNVVKRCRFEEIFTEYEALQPKERKPLGLVERITQSGLIGDKDKEEILKKAETLTGEEKERFIKILKAALVVHKKELDEELELSILSV